MAPWYRCESVEGAAIPNPLSNAFDLSKALVGVGRNGEARLIPIVPGPPARVDGFTVGAAFMSRPAPHAGEMHPDGDELLVVVSGCITVVLEEAGAEREVEVRPEQAFVVPRGVWHRAVPKEPSHLVHITPGPGGQHRPLRPTGAA